MLQAVLPRRDRDLIAALRVELEQRRQIEICEDVAVHREQRLVGGQAALIAHERERAGRTERLALADVFDAHTELFAIAEVRFNQLRAVADGNDQIRQALRLQPLDDLFEDRLFTDGEEGLRDGVREWAHAYAAAAGEDHRFHTAYSRGRKRS